MWPYYFPNYILYFSTFLFAWTKGNKNSRQNNAARHSPTLARCFVLQPAPSEQRLFGFQALQYFSRVPYIIAKKPDQWTENQKIRATILFENYPLLHQAYKHTLAFRNTYELKERSLAEQKFNEWISQTKELKMTVFKTVATSLQYHRELYWTSTLIDIPMQMQHHLTLKSNSLELI